MRASLYCSLVLCLAACGGSSKSGSTATTAQPVVSGDACAVYTDATRCDADTQDQCRWVELGIACALDAGTCPSGVCEGPHLGGCGGGADAGSVSGGHASAANGCTDYTDAQSCDADTADHCYWTAALCPEYILADGGTAGCSGGSCVQDGSGGGCGGGGIGSGGAGCGCAMPANTTGGGTDVCVEQIGGPAESAPSPITCQPLVPNCTPVNGDVCSCVSGEGQCKASPTVSGLCVCDNGIR